MTETPERDRLVKRMFTERDVERDGRVVDVHVTWGPDANSLTTEQRARAINAMFDADEEDARHTVQIRVSELKGIYKALSEIGALCKINVQEWVDGKIPKEVLDMRSKIGSIAEFPALFAGQNLPRKVYDEVRRELGEP